MENAAIFYNGTNVRLAYDVAPIGGGGITILACDNVLDLRVRPLTNEGLN